MSEAVSWRLRPDLICETVHTATGLMHVVKDPVTAKFFHFDPREFAILKLLEQERNPGDFLSAVRRSRPDESFTTDALLRFLAEARRSGLLLLQGGSHAAQRSDSGTPRQWSLLSWKLPLLNPAALIAALRPLGHLAFSRPAGLAWVALVASAAALVTSRFDELAARWPSAEAWGTPSMAFTILAVILACKVVHELAHALAADRSGVRVQECGVLLFYFIPCFYCDVSDAWLLRSRSQRMLISAAGMLAELGLAAVATWLWWFSHPGPIQSVCLAVMVTCSINTLLINGNPLLRFDGYFVLVDALGIPNLASRGAAWWSAAWEKLAYGLRGDVGRTREDLVLAAYGAAAFAYRLLVILGMLWAIHAACDARGAGAISAALAVLVAGSIAQRGARTLIRPWRDPVLRRVLDRRRAAAALAATVALIAMASLIPLPRSVEAVFLIEPASSTSVFVQSPGVLKSILPAGSRVNRGDVIAVLEDDAATRKTAELESQREIAARRLESARVRRAVNVEAGQEIPTLIESLAAVEERLLLARQTVNELRIVAPCDGRLIPPPNVPAAPASRHEPVFWKGTPFDAENLGCLLRQGTCVAQVTPSSDLCATACISQRQIELVKPGQAVRLVVDGMGADFRRGLVEEVSPAAIEELPRELAATRRIAVNPADPRTARPLEPTYRVRIRLVDAAQPAAIGSLGTARITCEKASLAARFVALLAETFRIDL
jgi:putative peptide zinc metalloprotease protein